MTTSHWTEPLGLEQKWGLDSTEHPAWLLVAHDPQGGGKLMRLRFGAGKVVRVVNERICRVQASTPQPGDAGASYHWFEGRSPGNTRVEVLSSGRGAVTARSLSAPRTPAGCTCRATTPAAPCRPFEVQLQRLHQLTYLGASNGLDGQQRGQRVRLLEIAENRGRFGQIAGFGLDAGDLPDGCGFTRLCRRPD